MPVPKPVLQRSPRTLLAALMCLTLRPLPVLLPLSEEVLQLGEKALEVFRRAWLPVRMAARQPECTEGRSELFSAGLMEELA